MKQRKFSFDIPRLKLGPAKSDARALHQHLALGDDSPPPTPKSVRPPLSPFVEAELRSACAYVLQNFKPSHVIYQEQYGNGGGQKQQLDYAAIKEKQQPDYAAIKDKQPLDYAAIKESVHRDMSGSPPTLSKGHTRTHEPAVTDTEDMREQFSSERLRYKPDVPTQDLFKQENDHVRRHKRAQSRADELMSREPSKPTPMATRERSGSHQRSQSSPMQTSLAAPKSDIVDRPRTAPRTDSMETTGSTPPTDTPDYSWSEKASTAMTSAVITPARSSKRTSSQAIQSGSEASSMPKVEAVGADWMKQQLDKHKKASEHRMQQERAQEGDDVTSGADVTPTQRSRQVLQPATAKVPKRKPVPSRSASGVEKDRPDEEKRQDSKVSMEQPRASSRPAPERPQPTAQQNNFPERSDSHQVNSFPERFDSRQNSLPERSDSRQVKMPERTLSKLGGRARSVTRQVKDYVRPGSAATAMPNQTSRASSRPGSRAASVTRHVKEYFRPGTGMSMRNPSVDLNPAESRSHSIDSYRSGLSDSSSNKWWGRRPSQRRQASKAAGDGSSPGTSDSAHEGRGRTTARDATQSSSSQTPKSQPVNLNRELPPLPKLDQWKEPEQASKPSSPIKSSTGGIRTPKSHMSDKSKHDPRSVALESRMRDRDAIGRSHQFSADLRAAVPQRHAAPPPAPPVLMPVMSATIMGPNDLDVLQWSPAMNIEPPHASVDPMHGRKRSNTMQASFSPTNPGKAKTAMQSPTLSDKSSATGKAQLVNYARNSGGPITGLRRTMSKRGPLAATTAHTPVSHSRNNSDHMNFSRKVSMDERMYDNRYRNMVEISSTSANLGVKKPAASPATPNSERKWWHRKPKIGEKNWMEQVNTSGNNSGVLVQDEVAGSPVARY